MEQKIPIQVKQIAESYHIKESDICYTAHFDLEEEYQFAQGYVLLAKKTLAVVLYKPAENEFYQFGGYAKNLKEAVSENKVVSQNETEQLRGKSRIEKKKFSKTSVNKEKNEPIFRCFSLEQIETLSVIREISGGVLVGKIKGIEQRICLFTNSRMAEFERLVKNFEKVKKGETLTKEDIEGKKTQECCPKCGTLYPDQERKICPRCMDKKSIFVRMLSYFVKYKMRIAVMCIGYIITAVLNLIWPFLSGTILYDKVLAKDEAFLAAMNIPAGKFSLLLLFVVLGMIGTKVTIQLLGIIQGVMTAKIVPEVVAQLKEEVFHSMGKLSISFYNSKQTGGLLTRVLDDASEVTGFFIDGVPYFFINILTIIGTCIVMFSMNPGLAFASLILLPFLTVISCKMMPRLWHFYGKRHRASRKLSGQMNDNITGARVVKAFGQEEQEMVRFGKSNQGVREAELAVAKYDNKYYALYSATENIAAFLVWGIGAVLVLNGSGLALGVLITFAGYVGQLNGPLDFMSYIFRWWTNSLNSAQRIFEIIDAVPEVVEKENPIRPEKIGGKIELDHVTFGYEPHKPILKDVSFKVEAGEVLGIVGRSGAGKSTLVNLISRLYDTEEGEIRIDGINVKDMGFLELRKNIAMVSQETYIFMGTVAENIAYARKNATRKEIILAAMKASAHDFICRMPDGYDTMLGSSGRSLSGGEKQRISIARAILADPQILILDEATAAVDTETELAIQESLERLIKGRTTLSIAHRLSTLRNANKLIVIEDGKVTEEGSHEKLLEQKGTYYKLMELQTKALAMRIE